MKPQKHFSTVTIHQKKKRHFEHYSFPFKMKRSQNILNKLQVPVYECKITITVRTWYLSVSTASKRVISLARTTPVLSNRSVIIDVSRNLHILL